jgi:hypothetical protein
MCASCRALCSLSTPPKDCPDPKKWRKEAGLLYLYSLRHAFGRRPFVTDNGFLGMGPDYLQDGDAVVIFLGARVPHIIRRGESDFYELVGESYVRSIVQGEFMESQLKTQMFILR